ncbi:MAG TPA: glycosyl hydrolase family 79 C-terminal domain-containing protein [Solirubrobacteraceae bacterium]
MRSGLRILLLTSLAVAAVAIVVLATSGGASHPQRAGAGRSMPTGHARAATTGGTGPAASPVAVTVDPASPGDRIQPGFLGLSTEFWAVEAYAGKHPQSVNPVFVQLVRNLIPNQEGVLRIGGVTTDHTWWPVPGVKKSPGLWYKLTTSRLEVMRTIADEVGAKLILGITFEVDSRKLAAAEGRAMLSTIGASRIAAFELGNEPELYGDPYFGFYSHNGQNVVGRPQSYGMTAFTSDFAHIASGLPPVPVAGPAVGAANWLATLNSFIAAVPRLGVVTVHRYPFEACTGNPAALSWPTIPKMLSPLSTVDVAQGVIPWVKVAHARGLPIRIGEMNNVACGNPPGIPNTFAMALWMLDSLYAYAQVGVDGVNVHTWPGAVYNLFNFKKAKGRWSGTVEPEYFGLLMFAQGAPAGSRLASTSSGDSSVRVWATRAADGSIRVTLINDHLTSTEHVAIAVKGTHGAGSVVRLLAASPSATGGVTFGGESFGRTTTGVLPSPPVGTPVFPANGRYDVTLPPASAALLTIG